MRTGAGWQASRAGASGMGVPFMWHRPRSFNMPSAWAVPGHVARDGAGIRPKAAASCSLSLWERVGVRESFWGMEDLEANELRPCEGKRGACPPPHPGPLSRRKREKAAWFQRSMTSWNLPRRCPLARPMQTLPPILPGTTGDGTEQLGEAPGSLAGG